MTDKTARVQIEAEGRADLGVQVVRVRCPWCRELHTHGWPLTTPSTRSIERLARCNRGRYVIGGAEPLELTPSPRGRGAA